MSTSYHFLEHREKSVSLTECLLNRQVHFWRENILRLERQDGAMAQHQRPQNLPAVLLLENPSLRPSCRLVPVLR